MWRRVRQWRPRSEDFLPLAGEEEEKIRRRMALRSQRENRATVAPSAPPPQTRPSRTSQDEERRARRPRSLSTLDLSIMIRDMALHDVSDSLERNLSRLALAVMLAMVVGLTSCAKDHETVRRRSPDGKVDALLVERETGAAAATPVSLYIVKAGDPVGTGQPVLLGDNFDGLSIKSVDPKLLSVTYKKGRIFK